MKFQPVLDWILIQPEEELKQVNSIQLPDSARNKPTKGTVIAVGSGRLVEEQQGIYKKIPLEIKIGDKVLFEKGSGQPIKENGKEYLFIKESNVLTVLVEE